YIWLDDVLYNQVLIEQGYGRYFDKYAFNSERMKIFSKASKTAKSEKRGIHQ
ncbi:MAG: thermonuclease family protein, partial [Spirochaetaceae bacterium]|nr:thermonuclease family protein [Spirochaetaceae bacterium]